MANRSLIGGPLQQSSNLKNALHRLQCGNDKILPAFNAEASLEPEQDALDPPAADPTPYTHRSETPEYPPTAPKDKQDLQCQARHQQNRRLQCRSLQVDLRVGFLGQSSRKALEQRILIGLEPLRGDNSLREKIAYKPSSSSNKFFQGTLNLPLHHLQLASFAAILSVIMELQADGSKSQSVDTAGKIRKFRWIIKNFSGIRDQKLYSENFIVDGNKWRILIYPKEDKLDHLSVCLDVADSATLPSGWSRYAQFGLAVIDQIDRKTSITKLLSCVQPNGGYLWLPLFLSLTELHNPRRGYLVNDACLVEAYISTDTTGLISHELIVSHEFIVETDSAIGNQKTTITRSVEITAPSSQPSCQIAAIEPKTPTKEDMNSSSLA
ncbi:uncharacterized protein LOC120115547 [Hibiscus syriacus]|uniref:uncharacterized protein LOC120115547 n=1 Tax=Hibiscus syriacus TaxID=106335 RepID=UPI001921780E|nr:uncharacterized protein LOC120115547 [Hibiscus syriacus]